MRRLEDELRKLPLKSTCIYASKQEIADASLGLSAMVTFIGLYLGIVFLIAGAAILALKELSESADNVERYIFFLCPMVLAVIHSYFGMQFSTRLLTYVAEKDQLFTATMLAAAIIAVLYGGYLIITYFSSKSIVRE